MDDIKGRYDLLKNVSVRYDSAIHKYLRFKSQRMKDRVSFKKGVYANYGIHTEIFADGPSL